MTVALELQYLPGHALELPEWSRSVLAQRPRPQGLGDMLVPDGLASFPRPEERHDRESRAELAQVLEVALARFRPHVAVLASIRALRQPNAFMVVVGQQPAL